VPIGDVDRERILSAAVLVFEGSEVFLAYAYGSRIHGAPRSESDLDIGYYVKDHGKGLSIQEEMTLAAKLSSLLDVEVDLRNLGDAPLEMRGRVLEKGLRIYCANDVARVNLERDLLSRYHDYKEEWEMLHRARVRDVAANGLT
jgi:predicted nucleotidyltransferase